METEYKLMWLFFTSFFATIGVFLNYIGVDWWGMAFLVIAGFLLFFLPVVIVVRWALSVLYNG